MGLKFNPLTAQFDLTGSGGGSSYIDGEVSTYNDLPLSSTTAPLNSAWLVREASGVWPVSRKQAGIYIRTATAGSSRDADYTYAGTMPDVFSDAVFTLYDDASTTRTGQFNLGSITAGQNRVLTWPDGNATIAAAPVSRLQQFFSSQTYNVVEGLNVDIELQNSISSCAIVVVLPRLTTDGARNGDEILLRPTSLGSGSSYTLQRYVWTGGGYIGSTETITTMEVGQTYRLRLVGGVWTLLVTPNLASPPAIGGTTPAAATFTNLTANTRVNLPNTNGTTAGDIYRNANTLRYRDSTNTERLLLNASDNLANLASAATSRTNLGVGSSDAVTFGSIQNTPIGSTSASSGAFTTLSANNGTLTASAPVLDLAQTWNNAAVAFTAFRINATNTNSSALSLLADFQVGGTTQFSVRRDGVVACANRINITSAVNGLELSQASNGASPVRYTVDSAGTGNGQIRPTGNVMEQIGTTTTSSQTFRLYNTTDAGLTNFERGFIGWSSNTLRIGTEKAGTGSARALEFQTDGITRVTISSGVGNITATNAFLAGTDCGGFNGLGIVVASSRFVAWTDGSTNSSTRDMCMFRSGAGILLLQSNTTDFNRIQFGGTTSSFPALKRSSTSLQVRLADDSAFAPLSCGALTLNGNLDASTRDIVTDTTTGTKIGTGTTQKLGFFNATPIVRPAAIADATDAATTQARLNDLLAAMRSLGLIAT